MIVIVLQRLYSLPRALGGVVESWLRNIGMEKG